MFYRRMSASVSQRKAVQIVAAKTDLSVGVTLSADNVMLLDWYSDALPSGAFTNVADVNGHPLLYPMSAKEPVLQRDIGVVGGGIGLAGKIPEGMRGVAIRSNEIIGVAGFLYPGSRVDLLMTFTPPGAPLPVTETVLQNVEVLTAGQTIEPDPQGGPRLSTWSRCYSAQKIRKNCNSPALRETFSSYCAVEPTRSNSRTCVRRALTNWWWEENRRRRWSQPQE